MGVCESQEVKKNRKIFENEKHEALNGIRSISRPRVKSFDELIINTVSLNKKKITSEYKINIDTIGSGSFGEVRKAKHLTTNETRAIKIISKKECSYIEQIRIMEEIEILKHLDHPNIVKIYEFFEDDNFMYIVMELISGGELFELISNDHHFNEKKAATIFKSIIESVNYLHKKNIVHRDLKPENILFTIKDNLKLVDFGSSQLFLPGKRLKIKHGTAYYVAPEVLKGSYNEKCDIWSCGVLLYIFLCGFPPFNGKDENQVMKSVKKGKFSFNLPEFRLVSIRAKNLITSMLHMNIEKRISAEDILKHEFFDIIEEKDNNKINPSLMKNLKNFHYRNKIQQAAYLFMINHMEDGKEKANLISTFKALDKNKDGVLSKEEILLGFQNSKIPFDEKEIDKLFEAIDLNKNGNLDYTEFVAAVIDKKSFVNDKKIRICFKYFDKNGDGCISLDELKQVFEGNQIVDDAVWEKLFNEADKDHNGVIDYEEFKDIFTFVV